MDTQGKREQASSGATAVKDRISEEVAGTTALLHIEGRGLVPDIEARHPEDGNGDRSKEVADSTAGTVEVQEGEGSE